jgi:hypothetical protein
LPLFERARIEVYLPDLPRPEYQDLLVALEQELTYAFGGCTTVRGLEGNYLSRAGWIMRDRVNVVYTDTPFALADHLATIERYALKLRDSALQAVDEEAVLVTVQRVYHTA